MSVWASVYAMQISNHSTDSRIPGHWKEVWGSERKTWVNSDHLNWAGLLFQQLECGIHQVSLSHPFYFRWDTKHFILFANSSSEYQCVLQKCPQQMLSCCDNQKVNFSCLICPLTLKAWWVTSWLWIVMPSLVQAGDCHLNVNSGETLCVAIPESLHIYQHLFNVMSVSTCSPDLVFTFLTFIIFV